MSSATAALDLFVNRLSGFSTPFSIELPSGEKRKIGLGEEEFRVGLAQRARAEGAAHAR